MSQKRWLVLCGVLWVGASVGVYALLPKPKETPKPNNTTVVTPEEEPQRVALAPATPPSKVEPVEVTTPTSPEVRPTPPVTVEPKKEPVPPPMPEPKKVPEPRKEPVPPPMPEPKKVPEPRKVGAEVLVGKERQLNRPDGAYTVESLLVRQKIKITGKVRTLTVNRIDGDSVLDASELEAAEIIVLDAITTRSKVSLCAPNGKIELRGMLQGDSHLDINAPNGTIELRGKVDVRSRLTIVAPNGRVTFTESTKNGKEGSKIDGESKVTITAKDVEFHGKVDVRSRVEVNAPDGRVTFAEATTPGQLGSRIDGDAKIYVTAKAVDFRGLIGGNNTRAFVTLTNDGSLKFAAIEGGARIEYKKAEPGDPEPTIDSGRVGKQWQVRKVD